MTSPLDVALVYIKRGWATVPVPYRGKRPDGGDEWQFLNVTAETAPRHFNGQKQNVGVILGRPSGGLSDVDLDCPEAIALAPDFLPNTPAIFGRASKQRSHRLYLSDLCDSEDKAAIQYRDPVPEIDPVTGKKKYCMLAELRVGGGGRGAQTVFPGSVHESGEQVLWASEGDPPRVDGADLKGNVARLAAAALLVRRYPAEGSRHDLALTLGGALAHANWPANQIQNLVGLVANTAGDDEWKERGRSAAAAVDLVKNGNKVRGLPSLASAFGKAVTDKLVEWLALKGGPGPWLDNDPPPPQEPQPGDPALHAEIERLARLDWTAFKLVKKVEAKRLLLSPSDLEKVVRAKRKALHPPPPPSNKPKLLVDPAYPDDTLPALRDIMSKSQRLYERGGVVRIAYDHIAGGSVAHEPTPEGFILETHFACQPCAVHFNLETGNTVETDIQFPLTLARMYLNWKGERRLPLLNGFTSAPILDNEGVIRTATGYDTQTGLWCEGIPDIAARVPLKPTIDQANASLLVLREFFKTFCFGDAKTVRHGALNVVDLTKPPGFDESAFICSLLGSVCRPCLWLAPGYLFRGAHLSGGGSGKGLLARCACAIAYGHQPAAIAPGVGDKKGAAEELEKRVASTLLEGGPAALFDNFNSMTLASSALESALTERPSKVRKFGTLDNVYLNALMSIFITGNGTLLARDLLRRIIPTEFDAGLEDPEMRPFKNDILADAMRQRDVLLVAALTIWRYGRTHDLARGAPLGSYQQWCAWARDPLLALGCEDPVTRMKEAKGRDPMRQMTTELFNAWWDNYGTSAKKASELADPILKIIDPHERGRQYVSGQLEKFTGTRVGGFVLTRNKGENYREAATYRLQLTEAPSAESPSLDTPEGTLAKAREAGAFFRLDPFGDLFVVEWPGPSYPNLDAAVRQHYVAILAILTNEDR